MRERCRTALDRWWSVRDAKDMGELIQLLDIKATSL
jgi:hypothetical protein